MPLPPNSIKDIITDHFVGKTGTGCRVTFPARRFYSQVDWRYGSSTAEIETGQASGRVGVCCHDS